MIYIIPTTVLILASSITSLVPIEENVVIKNADNRTEYECGRNVTFTCMFKKDNTFIIEWMNENDDTPIAKCVQKKCQINPVYEEQYSISSDMPRNTFNLTIIKVTMRDNGRKLLCSDGQNTDFVIIKIRKDYAPQIFEDTNFGIIEATSGCVSNDTKVSFKWIKISRSSKTEEEFAPKLYSKDSTSCSNDSECWYEQHIQYTEKVSSAASADGKYHFKIVAVYGNESKESDITVGKYMIEAKEENSLHVLFFGVFGGICVTVTVTVTVTCLLCKILRQKFIENDLNNKKPRKFRKKTKCFGKGLCQTSLCLIWFEDNSGTKHNPSARKRNKREQTEIEPLDI